ncbi:hypothetical protein ACFQ1L_38700 [Phytohabitans flavus]|uniref:hypothetical protein n=1 Tax=Phytohabitans flavus TaxID=1076124 RepID=UPI00363653E5
MWLAAYLSFLFGHRAAGRALIGLAMVPGAIAAVLSTVDIVGGPPEAAIASWVFLLADGVLLLATTAFQPGGTGPERIRPWLWALPVGTAAMAAFAFAGSVTAMLLDLAGLYAVLVVAAALAYLGGAALRLAGPTPEWSLALLVLAASTLGLRLVTLVDYALLDPASGHAWLAAGAAEAVALLAVGAPLAVLAARGLPRGVPA